jgi:hypothetical protein
MNSLGFWICYTYRSAQAWTCRARQLAWAPVPEHGTCPSLMEWEPTRASTTGGDDVLALSHLLSSMMLRRSVGSWPYSRWQWFWVIRQWASLSARHQLPLVEDVASLRACFAWSADRFPIEGSPCWFSVEHSATTIWPVASTPCWSKATSGESCRTIHWINSMIVWSLTTLKYGLRFQTTLLLGVWASDDLDPLMAGYLLELLWESPLVVPTILIWRASMAGFQ